MTTNKQLRELAEKATPGPWHESNGLGIVIDEIDCGTVCETHEDDAHDGRFIAAANPAAVLALLDAYEALQAECAKLRLLLSQSAPIVHAHAGASHMLDGFKLKRNKWDALVEQIDAAIQGSNP